MFNDLGQSEKLAAAGANWKAKPCAFPRVVIKGVTPEYKRRLKKELDELFAKFAEEDEAALPGSPFIRISGMLEDAFRSAAEKRQQEQA